MSNPFFSCICPTYKRPELLRNSLACFLSQSIADQAELIVLDDAGEWTPSVSSSVRVLSSGTRFESLAHKYNALLAECSGQCIVVWEDDDVYLPKHLETLAQDIERCGKEQYFLSRTWVYSNYGVPKGTVQVESGIGRFHGAWAFSASLIRQIGGYPETTRLDFDMQLRSQLVNAAGDWSGGRTPPTYVYRWGSGPFNGSQAGPDGYAAFWKKLASLPTQQQRRLTPSFDQETRQIHSFLQIPVQDPVQCDS